jgi:hypothetical protein
MGSIIDNLRKCAKVPNYEVVIRHTMEVTASDRLCLITTNTIEHQFIYNPILSARSRRNDEIEGKKIIARYSMGIFLPIGIPLAIVLFFKARIEWDTRKVVIRLHNIILFGRVTLSLRQR